MDWSPLQQLALIATLPTHHGKPPPLNSQRTESLFAKNHEPFFNGIGHKRKRRLPNGMSANPPNADIDRCSLYVGLGPILLKKSQV